jgi:hypothetical protein
MRKRQLTLEEVATEVSRIFGSTEKHARHWLHQRQELLKALATVRDGASALLAELGGESPRPRLHSRKKRLLSAQTRARMRAAARARWAQIRKEGAKASGK